MPVGISETALQFFVFQCKTLGYIEIQKENKKADSARYIFRMSSHMPKNSVLMFGISITWPEFCLLS